MKIDFYFSTFLPDGTRIKIRGNPLLHTGVKLVTTYINGLPASNEDILYAVKQLHKGATDYYGVTKRGGVLDYAIDRMYIVTEKGYKEAAKWAE